MAAVLSAGLAFIVVLRKRHSVASWCFTAGMAGLATEALFDGLSLNASSSEKIVFWQNLALFARSFGPGFWLVFSLTYSRGNYREFLVRWRLILAACFLLPVSISSGPEKIGRAHV